MANASKMLSVQVCYAGADKQLLYDLELPEGASLKSAIYTSMVLKDAPEIDLTAYRVGIYGKLKSLDTLLRDNDRVEIYRPLIADPKEARRKRAKNSKS